MAVRVFLSSKMKEFDQERAALAFQIASIPGFAVNAAEEWGALSASVEKAYTGGVRECHIYLGLFGRIYSAATKDEYDEACRNPYRQKLIYLKAGVKAVDAELAALIRTFESRHRPYRFKDLRDLQPRLIKDLDFALAEILNQHLQLGEPRPVAQAGTGTSVAEDAWRSRQTFLAELYNDDTDLTAGYLRQVREKLPRPTDSWFRRTGDRARGFLPFRPKHNGG